MTDDRAPQTMAAHRPAGVSGQAVYTADDRRGPGVPGRSCRRARPPFVTAVRRQQARFGHHRRPFQRLPVRKPRRWRDQKQQRHVAVRQSRRTVTPEGMIGELRRTSCSGDGKGRRAADQKATPPRWTGVGQARSDPPEKTLPDRYDPGSLARRQLRSWRRHSRVQVARSHHERSG
jgi:hypothetical protein